MVGRHCRETSPARFNEAPAIPPGKTPGRARPGNEVQRASMRPRRFRRGKPGPGPDGLRRSASSFNEAPAIPPGKTPCSRAIARAHRGCFNEAPAIPPGKTGQLERIDCAFAPASMRPRRFRRGKPAETAPDGGLRIGFNEAPAIPPGKTHDEGGGCERSLGRFNEAPAIPPGKTGGAGAGEALAKPRFNEAPAIPPGKTRPGDLHPAHQELASMRPRRFRRGKRAPTPRPDRRSRPLQ